MVMKVALLCGGKGSRWTRHADDVPKALAMIGDRPVLWHVMTVYSASGFNDFVLCLGHKGDQIRTYFRAHADARQDSDGALVVHPAPGVTWRIELVDTGDDAQTGARLLAIRDLVPNQRFLASYGDGLARIDINELIDFHRRHGRLATMTAVQPRSQFGLVTMSESGTVSGFVEKPRLSEWVNGGYFVFEPAIFDYLDRESLEGGALVALTGDSQLVAYRLDDFWACLDTYKDLITLDDLWQAGSPPWSTLNGWKTGSEKASTGTTAASL
jgi:glucose-1-phosphate cytidylyltransferase